jgi:hypothetical protein
LLKTPLVSWFVGSSGVSTDLNELERMRPRSTTSTTPERTNLTFGADLSYFFTFLNWPLEMHCYKTGAYRYEDPKFNTVRQIMYTTTYDPPISHSIFLSFDNRVAWLMDTPFHKFQTKVCIISHESRLFPNKSIMYVLLRQSWQSNQRIWDFNTYVLKHTYVASVKTVNSEEIVDRNKVHSIFLITHVYSQILGSWQQRCQSYGWNLA